MLLFFGSTQSVTRPRNLRPVAGGGPDARVLLPPCHDCPLRGDHEPRHWSPPNSSRLTLEKLPRSVHFALPTALQFSWKFVRCSIVRNLRRDGFKGSRRNPFRPRSAHVVYLLHEPCGEVIVQRALAMAAVDTEAEPSPSTHAILTVLKAGDCSRQL